MDTWYQLDTQRRITDVSPNFDCFSRENGGPPDLSRSVIGRPLCDFVTGESTRHLLQMLITQAEKGTVRVQMRCDSPHELRLVEMQVTPQLRVTFSTLKTQARRSSQGWQPETLIKLCSWCNTFETPQGWLTLEQAANLLNLLDGPSRDLSHGICPQCDSAFEEDDFGYLDQGFQV